MNIPGRDTGWNDLVDRTDHSMDSWRYRGFQFGRSNPNPWRFCPHCGEALDQAAAPFWSAEPLHATNEARVMEAESEGDD